jgi:hypothetical protein
MQLRFRHVRAQSHRVEIRDAIERLAGLDRFSCTDERCENSPGLRISYLASEKAFTYLCDTRITGCDLARHRGALRLCRLDLRHENAIVPLGLIELLRGCSALREKSPRPLIRSARNYKLGLKHVDLARRLNRPRCDCFALRQERLTLEAELHRIYESNYGAAWKVNAFRWSEAQKLSRGLCRHDDFVCLERSIGVGLSVSVAGSRKNYRQKKCDAFHQRTSMPRVVSR